MFNPGDIASTAGTSGVVYGVNGIVDYDPQSRVNTFAHVNHTAEQTRLGVLLCINGTGILNSWIRRNIAPEGISYADMNEVAATSSSSNVSVSSCAVRVSAMLSSNSGNVIRSMSLFITGGWKK